MHWLLAMAAGAVMIATGAAAQDSPHKPTPLETQAADAIAAVLRDECAPAAASLKSIYEDPQFSSLNGRMRSAVLEGADVCEARLGHTEYAFTLSQRAIQEPDASSLAWGLHIDLALNLSHTADAVSALTALARRSPSLLGGLREETIFSAYAYAEGLPNADARRLELLDALDKAQWRPKDPFNDALALKLDRIRLLLAAHRDAEAVEVATAINDPATLIVLRVDDRFASVAPDPKAMDIVQATRKALVAAVLLADKRPEWLSGPFRVAQLRMRLGEDEGALRIIQAALDRYRDFGASAFADADDHLRGLQALKAEVLARMGRLNEADGAFAEAAAQDATGDQGFEERLAYASYLIDTDRSPLALDLLHDLKTDSLTDTGKAYVAAMRACAYSVLKDTPAMRREMTVVTAPALPDYGALLNGLICAGDFDAAAKVYVDRLKDPAKRTEALLALQHYKRPATHGAEDKAWDDDYLRVQARPEVQSAIKAAGGRVETFDIFDPGTI